VILLDKVVEVLALPQFTRIREKNVAYAQMARALGGYGERVSDPDQIIPAIKRAVQRTQEGTPALLEFITKKELAVSTFRD
jgi:thiamine pyrophosphate-dependent acetolactate synthase large subunit-like protein